MTSSAKIRVGISGWTYPPWRGKFYPSKLPRNRELSYAAEIFPSIEINGTFYSLRRPESFAKWAESTPPNFVFSVKAPRFITHIKRLKDIRAPLANFFASGVLRLGPKLGPILWQFPPNFKFDPKLFENFFKRLPHTTGAAAAIAKKHDKRVSGRSWTNVKDSCALRHCVEIRSTTFQVPRFIELLRAYDIALVCADTVEWPRLMDLTSDFVYCRLHGSEVLYASGYDEKSLDGWATRIAAWARGGEPADAQKVIRKAGPKRNPRDVFVYFDNDAKVRAPLDAQSLMRRLSNSANG